MSHRSRPQATLPNTSQRAAIWWRAGVIVLAGMLVYSNSLSGPFVIDDNASIVNNAAIRDWADLGGVFAQRADTPLAGRGVVGLSFALNFALHGLAVQGYHLFNITIHALCALLLFGVVRRTLKGSRLTTDLAGAADNLAFATALVWTLHPLNSEAVNYLTERTESMMAMFALLTLYAGIRSVASRRLIAWQLLAVASCGLGMLCKESMVVAPVVVVLYDRIFLFDSLHGTFRARWRLYGGLATTWLVLAYVMLAGPRAGSVGFDVAVRPWTYLLNQAAMITRYLRLAIWPSDLVVNYGPALPLHLSDVLPQATLIVALLLATLLALARWPAVGFLGAWVFITLAPTSSLVPIATEVGAERRMYLPLMALVALVVIGAYGLTFSKRRIRFLAPTWALVAVSLALGATTLARNREYASGLSLAQSVLTRWPTDVAHGMVGSELALLHRDDESLGELRLAARTDARSRYNLGVALLNLGKFDEAIREFEGYASEHPLLEQVPSARRLMGHAFALRRKWPEAINQFTLVLSMTPNDPETRQLFVDVLNNQGLALADAGKFQEAAAAFRRALGLDPQNVTACQNLAAALLDAGDAPAAEAAARQAIALDPTDAGSYDLLGRALATQGHFDDAITQLEQALRLNPNDAGLRDDLDRVRRARGK